MTTWLSQIKNVQHVAANRLCVGCGVCFSVCQDGNIRLIDIEDEGIRPLVDEAACRSCGECLKVCPGLHYAMPDSILGKSKNGRIADKRWGGYIELWEGYASNSEIRFKGSSGGLCTAMSVFCLEQGLAAGVVHTGSNSNRPWRNCTYRSVKREELIARSGSRYAPASPGDGLQLIEGSAGRSVFIGKPCDIAGLTMAQASRPNLALKTALSIGFFCAGTPSTQGTLDFLKRYGVNPEEAAELRYRGLGWPGGARVVFRDASRQTLEVPYTDSWGFIQKYRPFRCYLCPDLTAEFADISVGDPWYREVSENEPGRSLILIRTENGQEIFREAVAKGYVTAAPATADIVLRSQKNLIRKRQAIWGRLLAMKLLGVPHPKLKGFHLFENWLDLATKEKFKSILGTGRRIIQRNYFKPLKYACQNGQWRTVQSVLAKK
jgi:coenzyme F420 hydrogenase subunit beta